MSTHQSTTIIILFAAESSTILLNLAGALREQLPGAGVVLESPYAQLSANLAAQLGDHRTNIIGVVPIPGGEEIGELKMPELLAHIRSFVVDASYFYDREKKVSVPIAGKSAAEVAAAMCQQLFRPNVACFVSNEAGQVLCCHRSDIPSPQEGFQIPQGGIEAGENYAVALARELQEETGLTNFTIIGEVPTLLRYIWPLSLSTLPYIGQAQKYFLVQIPDNSLGQLAPSDEFDFFLWADISFLLEKVVPFKRAIYQQAWELLTSTSD